MRRNQAESLMTIITLQKEEKAASSRRGKSYELSLSKHV